MRGLLRSIPAQEASGDKIENDAHAPSDNKQVVCLLKKELSWDCFNEYREKEWFINIENELNELL